MVISGAMLGFGASGTAIALSSRWVKAREHGLLCGAAALFAASLTGCHALAQQIPFETFQLASQPGQIRYLLLIYLVCAVPFFLMSSCIALAFLLEPRRVAVVYGMNMIGSGAGALGVVALMFSVHPAHLPHVLTIPAGLAFVLIMSGGRHSVLTTLVIAAALFMQTRALWDVPIRMSEYKGLSYALHLPDAEIVAEECSPASVVTAVRSKLIRETPGQVSYSYSMEKQGPLPEQIGLYFDGGAVSPAPRFEADVQPFAYLDYVTSALTYRLVERPRVLVIGAGGGTDLLGALWHGAVHVTAVEVDPCVISMIQRRPDVFGSKVYDRSDVTPIVAEGRGFLASREDLYDVIHIGLLDSFNTSAAGVMALNESYLYTREAVESYLGKLTPGGVLSITRWLKTPPRDGLKLFATAVEASESAGIEEPSAHLAMIRSWNTGTLIVSRSPLTSDQIGAIRDFCRERQFDLCYYPGIAEEETNRFTILDEPQYYRFAHAVLFGDRGRAYREALFNVRPATDSSPYYFHFFKWSSWPILVTQLRAGATSFAEWGYLILIACLVQSLIAGGVLVLAPVLFQRKGAGPRGARLWSFTTFTGLGLAYICLEIAFMQRFMLFLAYPTYAVSVVLTAFLIFSGLGSLATGRSRVRAGNAALAATTGIALLAVLYLMTLGWVFRWAAGWPDVAKILLCIGLLAPPAFCMGVPFPMGLRLVSQRSPELVPWVWAVNGCASVVGASLATLVAIHLGFNVLVVAVAATYVLTAAALRRLEYALE